MLLKLRGGGIIIPFDPYVPALLEYNKKINYIFISTYVEILIPEIKFLTSIGCYIMNKNVDANMESIVEMALSSIGTLHKTVNLLEFVNWHVNRPKM